MKRSGISRGTSQLSRSTGLSRYTPLDPGGDLARSSLARSVPLARTSAQDAEKAPRKSPQATGRPVRDGQRQKVYQRDGNRCARCGRGVGSGSRQLQHRLARQMGGRVDHDRLSALILLCGYSATDPDGCHAVVESNRLDAQAAGYLVPAGMDPETYAVRYHDGWFLLTDDGERIPTKGLYE